MPKHLLVAISPHGYGHAAQVVPVVNALLAQYPELRVTIQTTLPKWFFDARLRCAFNYHYRASDFGLQMVSAMDIDLEASACRYQGIHENWHEVVAREAASLAGLEVDLLLADIPYVPIAAAASVGIPVVALCSLNWMDIYRHYFARRRESSTVLAQMEAAYQSASLFLCPEPSMPMESLNNTRIIGPIAGVGENVRVELNDRLALKEGERVVLFAPGGVPVGFVFDQWPARSGVRWIFATKPHGSHPDVVCLQDLPYAFIDVLASVDAVVGKCGYGTVAECACNNTPLLYVPRPEWPEEACLLEWLEAHGRCAPVSRQGLDTGEIGDALESCLAQPLPVALEPVGAEQAAAIVRELLFE